MLRGLQAVNLAMSIPLRKSTTTLSINSVHHALLIPALLKSRIGFPEPRASGTNRTSLLSFGAGRVFLGIRVHQEVAIEGTTDKEPPAVNFWPFSKFTFS